VAHDELEDRKALRLSHPQLCNAVGEATRKLEVDLRAAAAARPPTPRRWPRLEELAIWGPDLPVAALEALGTETWDRLRTLRLDTRWRALPAPAARALAAALRRMPVLRALALESVQLPDAAAQELLRAASAAGAPQLRALTIRRRARTSLTPATARMLASAGWRLEALDLRCNGDLGAAGAAALVAAQSFAILRLNLRGCGQDAARLLILANALKPLEELNLAHDDFRSAAAGPALAAPARRRVGMRHLDAGVSYLCAAGFKALVEAAWPALTYLPAPSWQKRRRSTARTRSASPPLPASRRWRSWTSLVCSFAWRARRGWRAGAGRASGGCASPAAISAAPAPVSWRSRAASSRRSSGSTCAATYSSASRRRSRTRAAGRPRWRSCLRMHRCGLSVLHKVVTSTSLIGSKAARARSIVLRRRAGQGGGAAAQRGALVWSSAALGNLVLKNCSQIGMNGNGGVNADHASSRVI
jgi:hypothetical protein